ncbi:NYN domain-containing protein [Nocardia wallacei]|uniref:NYN domain-containing protein n=1 Tax=Nocardia wallacei TaxID=480035 RepID=UPI00245826C3|nr:NYN domain-containing protein [Nocardia wallacei]
MSSKRWLRGILSSRPGRRAPARLETILPPHDRAAGRRCGGVAVLIDADNVAPGKIGAVLAAVTRDHGPIRIKRAYGDFDRPHLAGWRHAVLAHAIRRIDAIAFSPGKNCSDHVLIADAIHLAHTTNLQTVVLVTSDADFTDLAIRLREYGLHVYGIGERKTSAPFRNACDHFTTINDLAPPTPPQHPIPTRPRATTTPPAMTTPPTSTTKPKTTRTGNATGLSASAADQLRALVTKAADKQGWANLSTVCLRLHNNPALKTTLNGELGNRPGRYLKQCGLFEVTERPGAGTFLRNKPHHP